MARHARSAAADRDGAARLRYWGIDAVRRHPALSPLASQARLHEARVGNNCPPSGWAVVASDGAIHLNPDRSGTPGDWFWAIAHCLLHLGFGHLDEGGRDEHSSRGEAGFDLAWNLACCLTVNRFLERLGAGLQLGLAAETTPYDQLAETSRGEEFLARRLRELGTGLDLSGVGVGGPDGDLLRTAPAMPAIPPTPAVPRRHGWADLLAAGLARASGDAVDPAGGATGRRKTAWRQALDWFMANYPLIGAIADAFTLVEDADVCHAHGVRVAAVSPAAAELYVNPLYPLADGERRFVIAHELLHAGLRHDTRAEWRDPWLWNVACDYVINGWLVEMGVGESPNSALYDRALRGMSAEEVYDRIATDHRRLRKLATLRGVGLADVLPHPLPRGPADPVRGVGLDEFYGRSLADGLGYHQARGRGTLPAGLVEELHALAYPPMPWDVQPAPIAQQPAARLSKFRLPGDVEIPRSGTSNPRQGTTPVPRCEKRTT